MTGQRRQAQRREKATTPSTAATTTTTTTATTTTTTTTTSTKVGLIGFNGLTPPKDSFTQRVLTELPPAYPRNAATCRMGR